MAAARTDRASVGELGASNPLSGLCARRGQIRSAPKPRGAARGISAAHAVGGAEGHAAAAASLIAMKDKEQLSTLISGIYDAAIEPAQRSDVLDRIARFTGGHSSGLLVKHSLTNSDSLYCYLGDDPESLQAYSEEYPELEPAASSNPFDAQQVVTTTDLVPYDEFRRGRFYREWAKPQGWVDVASAVIERSDTTCALLSVVRHEASGMVDDEMRRRMALIT